jgi:hypothetical protein
MMLSETISEVLLTINICITHYIIHVSLRIQCIGKKVNTYCNLLQCQLFSWSGSCNRSLITHTTLQKFRIILHCAFVSLFI